MLHPTDSIGVGLVQMRITHPSLFYLFFIPFLSLIILLLLISNFGSIFCTTMKIDRRYLSRAWEIRDKALEAKKSGQPTIVQAEASMTSKKRKQHIISRGRSGAQVPKVALAPPLTSATIIQVINLEEDMDGSSPALTSGIQAVVSQTTTLVTTAKALATATEAPATITEAPAPEDHDSDNLYSGGIFFYFYPGSGRVLLRA